jgi:hypothetical protein
MKDVLFCDFLVHYFYDSWLASWSFGDLVNMEIWIQKYF